MAERRPPREGAQEKGKDEELTSFYNPVGIPCFQESLLTGTGFSSMGTLVYYGFTRKLNGTFTVGLFALASAGRWLTCQYYLDKKRKDMDKLNTMQSFYEHKMREAYILQKRQRTASATASTADPKTQPSNDSNNNTPQS